MERRTVGLLINFNVRVLRDGIKRVVLNYKDVSASFACSLYGCLSNR